MLGFGSKTEQKEIRKALKAFSGRYLECYAQINQTVDVEEKQRIAQNTWSHIVESFKPCTSFFTLNKKHIQADTGANAFLPPEEVEASVKEFTLEDFAGYENYQPSKELAKKINRVYVASQYMPKISSIQVNVHDDDNEQDVNNGSCYMTYAYGTTQAVSKILEVGIQNKQDVIIVPTPTYGLLIPIMEKYGQIEYLRPIANADLKPNANQLRELIERKNKQFIKEYIEFIHFRKSYVSLLANSGVITEDDKAALISSLEVAITNLSEGDFSDKTIASYNQYISDNLINTHLVRDLKLLLCPRVRFYYSINPLAPTGLIQTQSDINCLVDVLSEFPDIHIIEDVVHRGIMLNQDKKMGSYLQSAMASQVFTVDGLSKIMDLGNARTGIILASKPLLRPVSEALAIDNCTYNAASRHFLETGYGIGADKFKAHLKDISQAYEKRLKLVRAIVYGVETMGDHGIQRHVKYIENKIKKIGKKWSVKKCREVSENALSGIPNVKFYVEPEAGYFVLLDFSQYLGKYLGDVKLSSGFDFWCAFNLLADVQSIPDILCADDGASERAYLRFSLSIDGEVDIIEGLLRIKSVLACCTEQPLFQEEMSICPINKLAIFLQAEEQEQQDEQEAINAEVIFNFASEKRKRNPSSEQEQRKRVKIDKQPVLSNDEAESKESTLSIRKGTRHRRLRIYDGEKFVVNATSSK